MYPVIAEPPSLAGVLQKRLTCVGDTATAVGPVGEPGTVAIANAGALALKNNTRVIMKIDAAVVFSRYDFGDSTMELHMRVFLGVVDKLQAPFESNKTILKISNDMWCRRLSFSSLRGPPAFPLSFQHG